MMDDNHGSLIQQIPAGSSEKLLPSAPSAASSSSPYPPDVELLDGSKVLPEQQQSTVRMVRQTPPPPPPQQGSVNTDPMNNLDSLAIPGVHSRSDDISRFGTLLLSAISLFLALVTLPFSLCYCIKVVQEYERAVIFRLGRLKKGGASGPGLFFILPCIDNYRCVDLRTVSYEVPPQEMLSRDSVTVSVDAVCFYKISNPLAAVCNVGNYTHSTNLLVATSLRNVLGTKTLAEILSERETICHVMEHILDEATRPWGVKVERVEIKDVRVPVQLQRAMAAEAEAAREARAKVVAAEGEQKASTHLKEAALVLEESQSALQLRYLQTLNAISTEQSSTIVFPFPIDSLCLSMGTGKEKNKND
ncbi:band 7 protein AGAP004871 isoform X1 [Lepeophtheirus salmonis]|uniref:Band 7 domain-containing protein n=2 Tax=Lepeophtheirus salmonis TaxID=72036 RepID=A0A0K2TZN4_LEPSM|nr:band 7 protein AGAP004871-like isoform X1 [Lepeophtheirus salmonis]